MKENKVVIVVSTYNNASIIEDFLKSYYSQTAKQLKLIISDDGSEDETVRIIKESAKRNQDLDHQVELVELEHGERGTARKAAIDAALRNQVEYLLILDSDMKMKGNLISQCLNEFYQDSQLGALVIPEIPYSDYNNYYSKVKVFERMIINNLKSELGKNSIEAARFWTIEAFVKSGGINEKQIAFEETQPTLRYLEQGGVIKRVVGTGVYHNEKKVTFMNLIAKKKYYFSKIEKTLSTEENGFLKALSRWYFFRPVLYRKENLMNYAKHPLLWLGMMNMYIALTFVGVTEILKSMRKG